MSTKMIKEISITKNVHISDEMYFAIMFYELTGNERCKKYLEEKDYVFGSFEKTGDIFTARFYKYVIREPTPTEKYAIAILEMPFKQKDEFVYCGYIPCRYCILRSSSSGQNNKECRKRYDELIEFCDELLKGKEIIEVD